jgi:hypothetical protein
VDLDNNNRGKNSCRKTNNNNSERINNLKIPKGLIESLNNAGFTIEMILNSRPSDIAQILGIDDYVAQIIYQETKYYYQMNI